MSADSKHAFNDQLNLVADNMGVALYQRFTLQESALFLRCQQSNLKELIEKQEIRYVELPDGQLELFGFHLIEYLLGCVSGGEMPTPKTTNPDKIIRIKDVIELTGISRTTLWRLEGKGDFPRRLPLSAGSVGWRYSEIEQWVQSR